jgi:ABC-type multidrug transport system ATPase subunit
MVRTRRLAVYVDVSGSQLPEPTPFSATVSKQITVEKSGRVILDNVNAVLRPGEITAVVGESGAGKTTLLRALAGLEGEEVVCGPNSCIYVQQNPVLLTNTVASELMLPSRLFASLSPAGQAYASLFQLDELLNQSTQDLSGGERQRLMLARQCSYSPSLFLLDECTSNLGWLHVQTIEKELLRMKTEGVCIVMVTHNISQAHRIADSIVVLRDGKQLDPNDPFAVSMLNGEWLDHDSTKNA